MPVHYMICHLTHFRRSSYDISTNTDFNLFSTFHLICSFHICPFIYINKCCGHLLPIMLCFFYMSIRDNTQLHKSHQTRGAKHINNTQLHHIRQVGQSTKIIHRYTSDQRDKAHKQYTVTSHQTRGVKHINNTQLHHIRQEGQST